MRMCACSVICYFRSGRCRPELAEPLAEPPEEPWKPAGGLILISDPPRNRQFHFGARRSAAEEMEPSSDAIGSLAHSRESPVSLAPRFQNLRFHPASIVAHHQAE